MGRESQNSSGSGLVDVNLEQINSIRTNDVYAENDAQHEQDFSTYMDVPLASSYSVDGVRSGIYGEDDEAFIVKIPRGAKLFGRVEIDQSLSPDLALLCRDDKESEQSEPVVRSRGQGVIGQRDEGPELTITDKLKKALGLEDNPNLVRKPLAESAREWKGSANNLLEAAKEVSTIIDPRKAAVTGVATAVLVSGAVLSHTDNNKTGPRPQADSALVVERVVHLSPQQIKNVDVKEVAASLGVEPKNVRIEDDRLVLPPGTPDEQVVVAVLEASAPETGAASESTSATSDSVPPVKTEVKAGEISPGVQRVNQLLDAIDPNAPTIDLTELNEAVKAMYEAYLPQDKDRLAGTPEGYIKMMLANEAVGINVPFTVAERTADVERYVAPETYSVFLATAKLYQSQLERYPALAGSMLRIRDGNAPVHKTHNNGLSLDLSSAMGWGVDQYADGPFSDYQFSDAFNQQFTEDLLVQMAKLRIDQEIAIHRVLSSGNTMVPRVNKAVGRVFMKDIDDNHKDHVHININPKFALPNWRARAAELPWGAEQDLRIGPAARPISPEQHASQHADFEGFVAENLLPKASVPEAEAPTQPEAAQPVAEIGPEALAIIDSLDLDQHQKDFLKRLAPAVVNVVRGGATVNPVSVLAQASLETGFGNDKLSKLANNFFGLKAGKDWQGETISLPTKEEYRDGQVVTITDVFRKYDSVEDSIADHAKLIASKPWYADAVRLYKDTEGYVNGLFNEVDANGNIIKQQGEAGVLSYGTDRDYEQKVFSFIERNKIDEIVAAQTAFADSVTTAETTETTTTLSPSTTIIDSTTTSSNSEEATQEVVETGVWLSLDSARAAYAPFFTGDDGVVDSVALEEWIATELVHRQDADGSNTKVYVDINITPTKE